MQPVLKKPFYAVAICASIIDTKGGARVDVNQRVLKNDDTPVDRLFAAGNCCSNVFGEAYFTGVSNVLLISKTKTKTNSNCL